MQPTRVYFCMTEMYMYNVHIAVLFCYSSSLQVFIPEWPVEEGWEDRMCKHLKKVLDDHFPASIKVELI